VKEEMCLVGIEILHNVYMQSSITHPSACLCVEKASFELDSFKDRLKIAASYMLFATLHRFAVRILVKTFLISK
jgi:hypothetical protein